MISKEVTKQLLKEAISPFTTIATIFVGIAFIAWLVAILLLPKFCLWSTLLLLIICFTILYVYKRVTKKLRLDIKTNSINLKLIEYSEVFNTVDYVAGSAAQYIPILGYVFPKLWGPKMTEINVTYAKGIDGKLYKIIPEADKGDRLYQLEGSLSHVHLGYILI